MEEYLFYMNMIKSQVELGKNVLLTGDSYYMPLAERTLFRLLSKNVIDFRTMPSLWLQTNSAELVVVHIPKIKGLDLLEKQRSFDLVCVLCNNEHEIVPHLTKLITPTLTRSKHQWMIKALP